MEFRNLIEYVHAGNVIPKGYWITVYLFNAIYKDLAIKMSSIDLSQVRYLYQNFLCCTILMIK